MNFRCSPTARPMGGVRRCSGSSRTFNVRCGPCAPAATAHRPLATALPENCSSSTSLELRASGGARDPHAHSSALRSLRSGGHPQRAARYALPRSSNFRCSPTARPMGGVRRCSGSSRTFNVRCGPCAEPAPDSDPGAATAHRPLAEPAPDPDPGALPENWPKIRWSGRVWVSGGGTPLSGDD